MIGRGGRKHEEAYPIRCHTRLIQGHLPGRHGKVADRLIRRGIVAAADAGAAPDSAGIKTHLGLDFGLLYPPLGQVMAETGHDDAEGASYSSPSLPR